MNLRFVLIGHPVAHSMSPVIHAAAYRELGFSHRYELLDAPDESAFEAGVRALRRGEIAGANVTVPYKRHALRLADRRDESAAGVGAANVLCRDANGDIAAYNTDVPALAQEISDNRRKPEVVLVLGSGGAALAAVAAAQRLGARNIGVASRRWVAEIPPADWDRAEEFRALGAAALPWPNDTQSALVFSAFCRRTEVLIQATSAGMLGAEPGEPVAELVPWAVLPPQSLAYDLVYNPMETPFIRAARARGLTATHGLGMLVGQAALAIELWLGVRPAKAPLYSAALVALAEKKTS